MEGSGVPAYFNNQSMFIKKAVIEEELQQGDFVWKIRSNGNMGLIWKGGITTPSIVSVTISYPAKPIGVENYTITHNESVMVNNPTVAGSMKVNYGDTITITATPALGYNEPTISLEYS